MGRGGRVFWALLLIGVGVLLLLRNADVIEEDARIWPLAVMAIGGAWFVGRLTSRERGGYAWPLILIGAGGLLLLQDLGVVTQEISVWPIVLIAIGVAIVLSAIPAVGGAGGETRITTETIGLDGATSARLVLRHGAGRLSLTASHEPGALLEGTFVGGAVKGVRREGDRLEVTLSQPSRNRFDQALPWNWGRSAALDWSVAVTRRVPLALEFHTGAGRTDLDLSDVQVGDLLVETGASETDLRLPSAGRVKGRIKAGAARVRVRVPDRVAASILVRGAVSSVRVNEVRFPRRDDRFVSGDYDTAEHRAELEFDVGAADIEIQ